MLIRTQKDSIIVALNQMHYVGVEEDDGKFFIVAKHENISCALGQYSSVKVANEVLDNLLRDCNQYTIYNMPEYQ